MDRRLHHCRLVGGSRGVLPDLSGAFVNPTLFSGVNNRMTIMQEEIFGPVAAAIEVDGLAEVLTVANDSIYGQAARNPLEISRKRRN